MGTCKFISRVSFAYINRSITMCNGMYASTCDMPNPWDRYSKNLISMLKKSQAWPNFDTELDGIMILQKCFQAFKINYIPRAKIEFLTLWLELRDHFIEIFVLLVVIS